MDDKMTTYKTTNISAHFTCNQYIYTYYVIPNPNRRLIMSWKTNAWAKNVDVTSIHFEEQNVFVIKMRHRPWLLRHNVN